jgi:AraC-like DNA-binding protein
MQVTLVGGEFFGIIFKHGTVLPYLPASALVDGDVDLPDASSKSFWLNGSAWHIPTFENADTFADRLVRANILARDPVIDAALQELPQDIAPRTVRHRFLHTTGLTQNHIRQVERAQRAAALLQSGVSILDAVFEAGYYDQPHLTRSLKQWIGQTPAQLIQMRPPG